MKTVFLTITLALIQFSYAFAQIADTVSYESQILKILEEHKVPGAAVALVSSDGIVWKRSLGLADIENNISVSDSTLFAIGSISKTFLSAAAIVAHESGILDIYDPIQTLVPTINYHNKWASSNPVRLFHLLEHTSGFDEAHFNLFPQADSSTPFKKVMEISKKSLETRWEPGRYVEYNTFGYVVAAHILEENSNVPFEDFMEENILLPLDIYRATYHPRDSITAHFSKGYAGNELEEVPFPSIPQWPAGTLTMTSSDLSKFVVMLLNNGSFNNQEIVSPSSISRMETPETSLQAEAGVSFGYGKGIQGKFEKGHLFYGHSGRAGGFLSEFGYTRHLDFGYVILINSVDGGKAVKAIKSVLLSSLEKSESPKGSQLAEVVNIDLSKLAGCYQPITSVPQLGKIGYFIYRLIDMPIIKVENGHLYQSAIFGGDQELLRVGDLLFKYPEEPMATSVFFEEQNGSWQWLTSDASYKKIPLWWGYLQFFIAFFCLLFIVTGFVSLLVSIPFQYFRKKKANLQFQLLPFLALCFLLSMAVSLLFYDPEKLYSLGAVLFLVFGWLFFATSFLALLKLLFDLYNKTPMSSWVKYHSILITFACCTTASYLLYWKIIGLILWSY